MAAPAFSKRNLRRMKRIRGLEERKKQRRPVMREWSNPKEFQAPFESMRRQVFAELSQKILTAQQWNNLNENMNHKWVWETSPSQKHDTGLIGFVARERRKIIEGKPKDVNQLFTERWIRKMVRDFTDPNFVFFEYAPNTIKQTATVVVHVGKYVTPDKLRKRLIEFLLNQNFRETIEKYNRALGTLK